MNIKYVSAGRNPSGYGEAARNFITALFCAGVNVTTETIAQMNEITSYGLNGAILDNLEGRQIDYKIKIVHLTPDLIPLYQEKGGYTISHLFWECDKLPKEWISPLNQVDEIWTASPQMIEMIKASGVSTPCYAFPQPIWTGKADDKIAPFSLIDKQGSPYMKDFTFYSIFQWIDRKNPKGLLRAYWKAFEGNPNVSLLLKTYRINYSESEFNLIKRDIEEWKKELKLSHYPKIYLSKKLLTQPQIAKLHKYGDCYIASSSGEGWNRPMQEAMLYGKPVISGDNGGITDLMTSQYYFKVPTKPVPATEVSYIPWYTKDQIWKELDEDQLASQMLNAYSHFNKAIIVGEKARDFVKDEFSFQKVGKLMYDRLSEIEKSL